MVMGSAFRKRASRIGIRFGVAAVLWISVSVTFTNAIASPSPEGQAKKVTCEQAVDLYERRVRGQVTATFGEDEWGTFLEGYNTCVDEGTVPPEMEAAIEWAVECAAVAGVDPQCPASRKNPALPPPPEPKKTVSSQSGAQPSSGHAGNGRSAGGSGPRAPHVEHADFWTGLGHGCVWPFRLVSSLISGENFWPRSKTSGYDLGFFLACIVGLWLAVMGLAFLAEIWEGIRG